jgi:hypothetical protein
MQERNPPSGTRKLSEAEAKEPPDIPIMEQMALYRTEILRRIELDRLAHRFLRMLTHKYGFSADEVIGDLLNHIFYDVIGTPKRLLASPTLPESLRERLKYPSPGDWTKNNPKPDLSIATKARDLADLIEEAEIGTPEFGLNELDSMESRTECGREQASLELIKLPATLRLYADYLEKSRESWQIMGAIEIDARTLFQKAVRHRGQDKIRARTGHFSDERYYRLLNIALNVVGRPEIDRCALIMRRTKGRLRRGRIRPTPPKNQ